jgi:hypothetical protein
MPRFSAPTAIVLINREGIPRCDSGKKNGFKCLFYLHKYRSDLMAKIRTDYVHAQQERYRSQLKVIDDASGAERIRLMKSQTLLTDKLENIAKFGNINVFWRCWVHGVY